MIRIDIGAGPNGAEWAEAGAQRAGSLTALARVLVSAGAPDQAWQAGWRGKPASLTGRSLHHLACIEVRDGEAGIRWGAYRPHPHAVIVPALAQVLAAAKQARAVVRERPKTASATSGGSRGREVPQRELSEQS